MVKYKVYIYQHNSDTFIEDQYFLVATTFVVARDVVDLTKKMNILNKVFDYAFDPLYYTDCFFGDIFRMSDLPCSDKPKQFKIPF
jgi:hypothetical protein